MYLSALSCLPLWTFADIGDDALLGKDVLDIGCNAGTVSLAVSRSFKARRVAEAWVSLHRFTFLL